MYTLHSAAICAFDALGVLSIGLCVSLYIHLLQNFDVLSSIVGLTTFAEGRRLCITLVRLFGCFCPQDY